MKKTHQYTINDVLEEVIANEEYQLLKKDIIELREIALEECYKTKLTQHFRYLWLNDIRSAYVNDNKNKLISYITELRLQNGYY